MNKDDRVIIACDYSNKEDLYALIETLDTKDNNLFLKIGMELYYKYGNSIIKELKEKGYKIFLDLKLHDIPNTVAKAIRNVCELNVDFITIHAQGGIQMMKAAQDAKNEVNPSTILLAVTVLTSLDDKALTDELLISETASNTVKKYISNAKEAGIEGIVCSPYEATLVSKQGLVSVTPGIRLPGGDKGDQKRVATPEFAREQKADYIVVGRSITGAEDKTVAYNLCKEGMSR